MHTVASVSRRQRDDGGYSFSTGHGAPTFDCDIKWSMQHIEQSVLLVF